MLVALSLLLLAGSQGQPPPGTGLIYRVVDIPGGGSAHLLTIDLKHAELRMLDARDYGAKALSAEDFLHKSGATAVFNASFFDVDGKILGLFVVDGDQRVPLRPVDWGVFVLGDDGARIVHTDDYVARPGDRQAFQTGPRLVVDGKALALKKQSARRTALCTLSDGRLLALVAGRSVDATVLANFLVSQNCQQAINLDGGPSTQLHLQRAGVVVEEPGGYPVPTAVGIFVRGNADITRASGCGCTLVEHPRGPR